MVAKKTAYKVLVGKPERKRPQRRLRHKWMNNIKIYVGYYEIV
jgi:hypothetical protein